MWFSCISSTLRKKTGSNRKLDDSSTSAARERPRPAKVPGCCGSAAMRAVIQRVTKASVTVGEEQVSSIGRGLCVLLGISVDDTQKDAEYMVRKILNLRLFEDESGRSWSQSVMDGNLEVLCVSQFTLQCILKGNKPDFHAAMPAELAQPFYNSILEDMRSAYKPELVKDGKFGAKMQVHIQNDGPVTVELTSPSSPTDPKQMSGGCFIELSPNRKESARQILMRLVSADQL
ncbi:D-aminoacyl-tRNA deacylase 1 isoform X2 [Oryzias melastigma]|uniref:D-aminoacyl-tRNA deacylase 1 isoform X2 n=1 Tax=Oryzias melastigma TaxID=30732 RepID=UPI000CF7B893|nr:D-aminoacyl-tRNA deacylase 1 isoform X2 [Oryzias melastigma]